MQRSDVATVRWLVVLTVIKCAFLNCCYELYFTANSEGRTLLQENMCCNYTQAHLRCPAKFD